MRKKNKYLGLAFAAFAFNLANNIPIIEAKELQNITDVQNSDNAKYTSAVWNNNSSHTPRYGDNITISTTGSGDGAGIGQNSGLYANLGGSIIVGNNLTINTLGEHADGIRTNPSSYSTWQQATSTIIVGDNLNLTTSGQTADGINANGYSNVYIGNNAQITTEYTGSPTLGGEGAHGVRANFASEINIGDGLKVETNGKSSHGLYAALGFGANNPGGAKINVGNFAEINTFHDSSHAAYVQGKNGSIIIGDNSSLSTVGNMSHGTYLSGANGKIILGNNTLIATSGTGSHGIYANNATGTIELLGDTSINVTGENSNAIYALNGQVISTDYSKYIINGNVVTGDNGSIDLKMDIGSIFSGTALQNAGNINISMQNGSKWYATDDWNASVTLEEGSNLYLGLGNNQEEKNITVDGDLTINKGTINFDSNIVNSASDALVIKNEILGTGGYVKVANSGSSQTNGKEEILLIQAEQGGAGFQLYNEVELGGYTYLLEKQDNGQGGKNWHLRGTGRPSGIASAGVNVFSGNYLLNYAEKQTLQQRLGELHGTNKDSNIWARMFGGKFDSASDSMISNYSMSYSGFQMGGDKDLKTKNDNYNLYFGWMLGYSKGNLNYNKGKGSIDSKTIGTYLTYIDKNGLYVDAVLKYGWMKNKFETLDSSSAVITGEAINTNGMSFSTSVGKRFNLSQKNQGWYFEPQAQLTYGTESGDSFTASNGLNIDVDNYNYLIGSFGLTIGYEIKNNKNPLNVYFKANYIKEFDGLTSYRLNNSQNDISFKDSRLVLGLGITAQIAKKHNIYFEIEKSNGKKFGQPWAISGGYRFSF